MTIGRSEDMKETITLQKAFIYIVILFWGVPFVQDLLPQKDAQEIVWTCVYFINAVACIIVSYSYTKGSHKVSWYLPLGCMLIFLPLPFLFYELSYLIALPLYGACSMLGMMLTKFIVK